MPAGSPENRNESQTGMPDMALGVPLKVGSFSIDDAIQMHLVDCEQCHAATEGRPRKLGQRTGLCDTYLHLQMMRANYEGKVNNVVAHTEEGYEAPRGKPLE